MGRREIVYGLSFLQNFSGDCVYLDDAVDFIAEKLRFELRFPHMAGIISTNISADSETVPLVESDVVAYILNPYKVPQNPVSGQPLRRASE